MSSSLGRFASKGINAARIAAASGANPAEAIKVAKSVQPRQLLFDTAPGLEHILEREIKELGIAGADSATSYTGGVAIEGPEESLWRPI